MIKWPKVIQLNNCISVGYMVVALTIRLNSEHLAVIMKVISDYDYFTM